MANYVSIYVNRYINIAAVDCNKHDFNRNLGNNLITCIKDKTFSKLEQLQTLTLSENEMTSLQREVFGERIPNLLKLLVDCFVKKLLISITKKYYVAIK